MYQYLNSDNLRNTPKDNIALLFWFALSVLLYFYFTANILFPVTNLWYYSGTYNFSFIVVLISIAWIVLVLGKAIIKNELVFIFSLSSYIGVIFCSALGFIAFIGNMTMILQLCTLWLLWFLFRACFGRYYASSIKTPFLLLSVCFPFFSIYSIYEVPWIKNIVWHALVSQGYVISITNDVIETNNIIIHINKTCSSLRYMNVSLILSIIYGYVYLNKFFTRILHVALVALSVFALNILRLILLTIYAHRYGIHEMNMILAPVNWLLFILMLLGIVFFANLLRDMDSRSFNSYLLVYKQSCFDYIENKNKLALNFILMLFLLLGFNKVLELHRETMHYIPITQALRYPDFSSGWHLSNKCNSDTWSPIVAKPDAKLHAEYYQENSKNIVSLYMGYYQHQYDGNSLTNLSTRLNFSSPWIIKSTGEKVVKVFTIKEQGEFAKAIYKKVQVNTVVLQNENEYRLVWYWYWVNGSTTNNKIQAKGLEIYNSLKTLPNDSALIAVSANFHNVKNIYKAETALTEFMSQNYLHLYPRAKKKAIVL